jgi:hypothetical protein
LLWEDVRDTIAKSSFKQLPDKLPKRLGTPFQLFSLNLKQSGCEFTPKEVFLMWVRFPVDDKALYIRAQKTAIELYTGICMDQEQQGPKARLQVAAAAQACTSIGAVKEEFKEPQPEIQVSDTNPLFLIHTKAGRIAKANRPKSARLRSYKHNKAPSDVASLSPFASFVRQVRVAINDDMDSDKPGYETYRALKDLWGLISDETKKAFSE